MRSPVEGGPLLVLDTVDSTQAEAARRILAASGPACPGAIVAIDQTDGKGRFGRRWHSEPGSSLAMSLVFAGETESSRPWLLGMAVALAAAGAFRLRVAWPNDLMLDGMKVGGVLTEMLPSKGGKTIPVVGIGVNLNQRKMPMEVREFATSLVIAGRPETAPLDAARAVLEGLESLPEPISWEALAPVWRLFDATRGKRFRLADGEEGIAAWIGPQGELVCQVGTELRTTLAADALFGGR